MKEEAIKWLGQAIADLRTSGNSMKSKDYYASAFWSQQAVEKGLKAIYILKHGALAPKIHDLVELCRLINASEEITLKCSKLILVYTSSRYPGAAQEMPKDYYDDKKAQEHLKLSTEVMKWIEEQLK